MHEIELMQRALDIALEQAVQRGTQRIHKVTFRVGAESGVVPEVIEMAFAIAIQATPAAGAQLAIDFVPLICFCHVCNQEFQPVDGDLLHTCPLCHNVGAEVRRGREFEITSIELS
jgi:hydrogenase nickel incorporation protein HypA/HybF